MEEHSGVKHAHKPEKPPHASVSFRSLQNVKQSVAANTRRVNIDGARCRAAVVFNLEDTYMELFFDLPLWRAVYLGHSLESKYLLILGEIAIKVCYQQQFH